MKFAILVYEKPIEFSQREEEGSQEYWAAYQLYSKSLTEAGG